MSKLELLESEEIFFRAEINYSRHKYKPPSGIFSFFTRYYLSIAPQSYLKRHPKDLLMELYRQQEMLLRKGVIVWGHTIRANTLLFEPGNLDCPADIVYSLDQEIDGNPLILEEAAHFINSTKGKQSDPDLQHLSDHMSDEYIRDWKLNIPPRYTNGIQCFLISTMIIRRHLPENFLAGSFFPFLVSLQEPYIGMVLPCRYWSKRFKNQYWG